MAEILFLAIAIGIVCGLVWILLYIVTLIVRMQLNLGEYIFHSDGFLPARLLAIIPWIPLTVIRYGILFIGFIAAVDLANKTARWLDKD